MSDRCDCNELVKRLDKYLECIAKAGSLEEAQRDARLARLLIEENAK